MCEFVRGGHYEPPSWDICDEVYERADQLATQDGNVYGLGDLEGSAAEPYLQAAGDIVHPNRLGGNR